MIPEDSYTPHGYLDNPYHSRNHNPSGVVRSLHGMGFGWHFPALGGGYGFREVYRAGMRLYLVDDVGVRLELEDLPGLVATRHTKNEFRYHWRTANLSVEATYFLVGENVLACRTRLLSSRARRLQVGARLDYTRHLGAAGVWGESGLVGRLEQDVLVLHGFEDGEAFALSADRDGERAASAAPDEAFLRHPTMRGDHVTVTGSARGGESVRLSGAWLTVADLEPEQPWEVELLLARHIRPDLAVARAHTSRHHVSTSLAAHRAQDQAFWDAAPVLVGDWPAAWRRGVVYDLETLRMMVRQPLGIYRHVWDAMQIQAPRVVLAEAAIDALLLSYADLATAKALLLGTFLDAPKANVPCSREDGSFNMVGANGSACGTAPEWGYPVRVAKHLFDRDRDTAWLQALFPALERFLTWWIQERSDAEGFLVYDNSWESGQDLSARFGPQKEGGGSTIREVRPVDLQAAMVDACATMAEFAAVLGLDAGVWQHREDRYRVLLDGMWCDDGYRDFDTRVGWSDVPDVMQLAPLALGLASSERKKSLAGAVAKLPDDDYLWPMFIWTAVDAAHAVENHEVAGEIVRSTLDRAYGAWDRRELGPGQPLPGVSCEYWGTDDQYGAEGYGWGAFGVHLIFRSLLGYQPTADGFMLRPNLPASWGDGSYRVVRLNSGTNPVDVNLTVRGDVVTVQLASERNMLSCRGATGRDLGVVVRMGEEIHVSTPTAAELT